MKSIEQLEDSDNIELILEKDSLLETVKLAVSKIPKAIEVFEEWEFVKDYKYAVLSESEDFEKFYHQVEQIGNPVNKLMKFDDQLMIKYTEIISAFNPSSGEEELLNYPIIVVLHKEIQVIEIRFDGLKEYFRNKKSIRTFQNTLIDEILQKIEMDFSIKPVLLELDHIKEMVKEDEQVKLIAQHMKMMMGGQAQLEVGKNEAYELPLIDEIKAIMLEHSEELKKVEALKYSLEQYIYEIEEMSDYSWIQLLWEAPIKTRSIKIKVLFADDVQNYALIQYYASARGGMEKMNYVSEYICSNRKSCQSVPSK